VIKIIIGATKIIGVDVNPEKYEIGNALCASQECLKSLSVLLLCSSYVIDFEFFSLMYLGKKFGLTDFVHAGESEDKSMSQVYPLLRSHSCFIHNIVNPVAFGLALHYFLISKAIWFTKLVHRISVYSVVTSSYKLHQEHL